MASSSGKRTSSSKKSNRTSSRNSNARSKNTATRQAGQDRELFHDIGLIIFFIAMVLLFLCNFGIIGPAGDVISDILFGLFGMTAYITPILLFLAIAFWSANKGNTTALRRLIAGAVLFIMIGVICDLMAGGEPRPYDIKVIYESGKTGRNGGGALAGSLSILLLNSLEIIGTVLVVILCSAISLILLTEKSLLSNIRERGARLRTRTDERSMEWEEGSLQEESDSWEESYPSSRSIRRENRRLRKQYQEEEKLRREEEKRLRAEEKENERILRMDKKVSGVIVDTQLPRLSEEKKRDDIHEITYQDVEFLEEPMEENYSAGPEFQFDDIKIHHNHHVTVQEESTDVPVEDIALPPEQDSIIPGYLEEHEATLKSEPAMSASKPSAENRPGSGAKLPKKYIFPPISRLKRGSGKGGDSARELKETALRLQQTLGTFGVRVIITDISQGPSVTRYELQPEQGVKVSKIVGLADDIKLNLAATDIRIEAPIPGKAAIGIEVPNKENMPVALRDLLESKEFKEYPSNLTFAVGKDIAGQVVVADIANMPHMLVAGATGSGKSVCINTLIMSLLYKAHPDDVKLIMIDPKVVELSVYNGIPHLLIPVVTDPKKAAAALHWGVAEMTDRYKKFADYNVRDLKGYNKVVESMDQPEGQEEPLLKMPQIVIIVDELADLMMVAPGEVEESICRLAQLARAAGIHLIIATQRPSVDVITGLIKANMPSRLAFAVSSGVDSRTILDMIGAEKLLGKGDMLFYPKGYSKPARIQGAFVSDKEVSDVVDFIKNQTLGNVYAEEIEEQIKNLGSAGSGLGTGNGNDDRDEYFAEAGRFIIDKDKASIGMLQRVFKIGFNRAARIMDQLCTYGVVGEEEGTKPRKVLMSQEQFEQLLDEA